MKGQWIGKTTGDIKGLSVINVDDLGKYYEGVAYILPFNEKIPVSAVVFKTKNKDAKNDFKAYTTPINPRTGLPCISIEEREHVLEKFYPGIAHSKQADVTIRFKENKLNLKAKTDIGLKIESNIIKKPSSGFSDIKADIKHWEEYKRFISTLSGQKKLFRGQRKSWKLRTAFHRKERYNLTRFLNEDIPQLHRHLSSRTSHVFNLDNPIENGAFLNLVQHHGYPTPLLDWTYSPYMAAFFAFRTLSEEEGPFLRRIFIFDQEKWRRHWPQLLMLNTAGLHLSIMEFLAIENERLIPQQGATTATNIDDIESYISESEVEKKCSYLTAIDIPDTERKKVLQDLSLMGITAGSMFPGLDGACEELSEKMFEV